MKSRITTPIIRLPSLSEMVYPCYVVPKSGGRRVITGGADNNVWLNESLQELGFRYQRTVGKIRHLLPPGLDGFINDGVYYIYDYFRRGAQTKWYSQRIKQVLVDLYGNNNVHLYAKHVEVPVGVWVKNSQQASQYKPPFYLRVEDMGYIMPYAHQRKISNWFEWNLQYIKQGTLKDLINVRGRLLLTVEVDKQDLPVTTTSQYPTDLLMARKQQMLGRPCTILETSKSCYALVSVESSHIDYSL